MRGPLIIISGPSGVGKSTVIQQLLKTCTRPIRLAISMTTRAPRPGEIDGVHYHFRTEAQFLKAIEAGEFLEYANVHGRNYYGTPVLEIEPYRQRGKAVLLDIDVQGASQVRAKVADAYAIFLHVPKERYEQRLRDRGTETEEAIQRRLQTALKEMERMHEYHHQVVNDSLDETVQVLNGLVEELFSEGEKHAR